jgi:ATP-dependent Clp protease ATP-binding subunit ClpA
LPQAPKLPRQQKNNKINIAISKDAYDLLYSFCWQDKPRSNGGRGIGNVIEEQYLNPLAEFIFDNNCQENDTIGIKAENGALVFTKPALAGHAFAGG